METVRILTPHVGMSACMCVSRGGKSAIAMYLNDRINIAMYYIIKFQNPKFSWQYESIGANLYQKEKQESKNANNCSRLWDVEMSGKST